MNAAQYDRVGEPTDVLTTVDVAVREPRAGEVRLRLLRSPIHNHDLATIRGVYGVTPTLPAIAGSELLGIVEAVGEGVALPIGARVATVTQGAWADQAIAVAQACVPMPAALDDETACQLLAMPLSALVLLDELRVKPGAWIVQNAANGAVGRTLVKLAQARGVNVINLVRREDAAAELRALGAAYVVVTSAGWNERVREITKGAKVDRIVDSVVGPEAFELQRHLGPGGEYVIFGALAAGALRLDPGAVIFGETIVRGFWMTAWMGRAAPAERIAATGKILAHAVAGDLSLEVGGTFPLARIDEAVRAAETPGRPGKILLTP